MSPDFVISALTFSIVMVIFNIVKDYFIIPNYNLSDKTLKKVNKRWYISFMVGIVILYLDSNCWWSDELHFLNAGWIYHFNAIPQNERHVGYWMERTYKELYD